MGLPCAQEENSFRSASRAEAACPQLQRRASPERASAPRLQSGSRSMLKKQVCSICPVHHLGQQPNAKLRWRCYPIPLARAGVVVAHFSLPIDQATQQLRSRPLATTLLTKFGSLPNHLFFAGRLAHCRQPVSSQEQTPQLSLPPNHSPPHQRRQLREWMLCQVARLGF